MKILTPSKLAEKRLRRYYGKCVCGCIFSADETEVYPCIEWKKAYFVRCPEPKCRREVMVVSAKKYL